MARTWSPDNPKAALMARKRAALVAAALKAFLDAGFAESSVNQIAADAGVSIKTLYRHFESKADLFSAVMEAACGEAGEGEPGTPPAWYADPPEVALARAGEQYLRHVLSRDQVALYRVVARDAERFPELGRRYREATAEGRDAIFGGYLDAWKEREGWEVADPAAAGQAFAGLLKAGLFDEVILGLRPLADAEIPPRAAEAARRMLILLEAGRF